MEASTAGSAVRVSLSSVLHQYKSVGFHSSQDYEGSVLLTQFKTTFKLLGPATLGFRLLR